VKYFIDFEAWVVEAKDVEDAWVRAKALIKEGYVPHICNTDLCEADDGIEVHNGYKREEVKDNG